MDTSSSPKRGNSRSWTRNSMRNRASAVSDTSAKTRMASNLLARPPPPWWSDQWSWIPWTTTTSTPSTGSFEVWQLFNTWTRVWSAGGQASLHLHTLDNEARAVLDLQLGHLAPPRPGAPDVRGEGPGKPGPQHKHPQQPHPPAQPPHHRRQRWCGGWAGWWGYWGCWCWEPGCPGPSPRMSGAPGRGAAGEPNWRSSTALALLSRVWRWRLAWPPVLETLIHALKSCWIFP